METARDIEARGYAATILSNPNYSVERRLAAAQVLATDAIADEIADLGALIEKLAKKREATLAKILSQIDMLPPGLDPQDLIA